MAKRKNTNYQFNVGEKTLLKYKKEVANTKAKIRRLKNEYGIDMSDEIKIPALTSFKSRKSFNNWVQKVQSFRNRHNLNYQFVKNDYGIVASKKEINELERKNKARISRAKNELKKFEDKPFIQAGKQYGTLGMQPANRTGINIPAEFDFSKIRTPKRLDSVRGNINRGYDMDYNKRYQQMKDNFIEVLKLSFNSNADELIKEILNIPADDFFEIYLTHEEFDFDLYDSEGQDVDADEGTIAQMLSYIKSYKKGNFDLDYKHENFS